MNARFQYLYRDGANYKKWGEVVFSNDERLHIEGVNKALRSAFPPDGLFIAHQIRIPEAFFTGEYPITALDHCFHEFCSLEPTPDLPTDLYQRSIQEFLVEVVAEAARGWIAFDPQCSQFPWQRSVP